MSKSDSNVFTDPHADATASSWVYDERGFLCLSESVKAPKKLGLGQVLVEGSAGDVVTWLQGRINQSRLAPPVKVSGTYDADTAASVSTLQRGAGQHPNGIADQFVLDLVVSDPEPFVAADGGPYPADVAPVVK